MSASSRLCSDRCLGVVKVLKDRVVQGLSLAGRQSAQGQEVSECSACLPLPPPTMENRNPARTVLRTWQVPTHINSHLLFPSGNSFHCGSFQPWPGQQTYPSSPRTLL